MSDRWELNKNAFEELLSWLDPDREAAARKYETIRGGLIKIMFYSSDSAAEELADEIINRVAMRLPEIRKTYRGNPARYFYGVARKLALEYQRRPREPSLIEGAHAVPNPETKDELRYECLESCLQRLTAVNRELFRRYYEEDKPDQRKELAKLLGITEETLRVRIHRIVQPLKKCVNKCMQKGNPMK